MPSTQRSLGFSHLRVGIFVLVALVVLGFLIINSTGEFNPFEKRMQLKARFASADGLREGAEVQLAGVPIGRVEEVKFLPPDSPEDEKVEALLQVTQTLDGRPITERVRTDSTARLVSTSLLANDKMINILPGTTKGSPVSENSVLQSSEAISINQLTQTGNELLQQINKLSIPANEILNKANRGEGTLGRIVNDETLYTNLDATVIEARATMSRLQDTIDRINRGEGTAAKLLNDPSLYNNINKTITDLEGISRDLRSGRGTAGKFLTDDAVYNETRAAIQDVRDAMRDIKPSLQSLDRIVTDVGLITTDINQGRGSLGKLLRDEQLYEEARNTLARFNTTSQRLEILITNAQQGQGTVGKLLTDEALYNNLNQTSQNINQITTEGTKLIYDFRQNPKKYLTVKFSIF
ncbi:MAG TPA: MlaD family protein [Pyrinomonadaceae bacterium]|nr:MlaD family protein [Pyrinomonadaceae bacterium]